MLPTTTISFSPSLSGFQMCWVPLALPQVVSMANSCFVSKTDLLNLTCSLLPSRKVEPDPKMLLVSESRSVTFNERSFQGIHFTRGNWAGHFTFLAHFFKDVGGFLRFTHLAYSLVTPPSWNENQQSRLQVRARTFSAPNVCQSQQMIDQSWGLNSDHLYSYEMLNGFLPP